MSGHFLPVKEQNVIFIGGVAISSKAGPGRDCISRLLRKTWTLTMAAGGTWNVENVKEYDPSTSVILLVRGKLQKTGRCPACGLGWLRSLPFENGTTKGANSFRLARDRCAVQCSVGGTKVRVLCIRDQRCQFPTSEQPNSNREALHPKVIIAWDLVWAMFVSSTHKRAAHRHPRHIITNEI